MENVTLDTLLLHDLHVVGDSVFEAFEELHRVHGVDLSRLDIGRYFPSEVSNDAFLISFFGRSRWAQRVKRKYPPLPLRIVSDALEQGSWPLAVS